MHKYSILFFCCLFLYCHTEAKDYTDYHKAIIKAERQIFISNQVDSGLNTYMNVFKEFDFVFLHDCMTAAFVALEYNKEKAFMVFMDKATQNGLMKRHYPETSTLKQHTLYEKNKNKIDELYVINRPHYLKRLDTAVIKKLYSLYEYDQSQKNYLKPELGKESASQYKHRYGPVIKDIVNQLKELIAQKGWPSDKLAGIDQEDIFKELKLQGLDLTDYYNKYKETNECTMGAYDMNEQDFASTLIQPILIHHNTLHGSGNLYDTIFYRKQIASGNLHPKDFALMNDDRLFMPRNETSTRALYFDITWGKKSIIPLPHSDDNAINAHRKRFLISPIEVDRAKWKFLQEHGWRYNYGNWGQRS